MTLTASLFPDDLPGRSEAVLSPDGLYRYVLRRAWEPGRLVTWVLLNPSTADATVNDATVRQLITFSRRWGMGGLAVVNLFAWRSRDPRDLVAAEDPIGPENADAVAHWIDLAHLVVVGWGTGPSGRRMSVLMNEAIATVTATGRDLVCLGMNANGSPKHPLYLAHATQRRPWPVH